MSNNPLFIWGAGIRGEHKPALEYAVEHDIPIVLSWGAIDLLPNDHPLNMGCFGTHGIKSANLAVQNSTEIISLGCRLDTKATGTPQTFAPKANIYMVDIDQAEIDKMPKVGRNVEGRATTCKNACERALGFMRYMGNTRKFTKWLSQCQQWREEFIPQGEPYDLMRRISEYTTPEDIIVSDTGNTLGWIMQGFPFKGERFIHAFNFTPMGYGLAGAVGASFAVPGSRVVCIVGDGGALMSINELATIARHNLNIKIILLNNSGHGMCRHTQRQWLGGKYYATSIEGGLGFPFWLECARSFNICTEDSLEEMFAPHAWAAEGPCLVEVKIDPDATLAFQVRYGEPLED